MLTRRSFLAALSCLPFVGKWRQQPPVWIGVYGYSMIEPGTRTLKHHKIYVAVNPQGRVVEVLGTEWDRKHYA